MSLLISIVVRWSTYQHTRDCNKFSSLAHLRQFGAVEIIGESILTWESSREEEEEERNKKNMLKSARVYLRSFAMSVCAKLVWIKSNISSLLCENIAYMTNRFGIFQNIEGNWQFNRDKISHVLFLDDSQARSLVIVIHSLSIFGVECETRIMIGIWYWIRYERSTFVESSTGTNYSRFFFI